MDGTGSITATFHIKTHFVGSLDIGVSRGHNHFSLAGAIKSNMESENTRLFQPETHFSFLFFYSVAESNTLAR